MEAGLRTGNLYSPWPEEANRKLTSALAARHFAPTEAARANLLAEGVDPATVHVTGNTVIDALLEVVARIEADAGLRAVLDARFGFIAPGRRVLLVTGHRRESFGAGFERICAALAATARRHPDLEIVYPVHLNPNVQEPVRRLLSGIGNVHLIEPLDYLPFVYLMHRAHLILTDSGGVQEEAPSLGKPVLVMRDTTERPEAVAAGTVRLVGTDERAIRQGIDRLLGDPAEYERMSFAHNPYGDGRAVRPHPRRPRTTSTLPPAQRGRIAAEAVLPAVPFETISVVGLGYIGLPTAAVFAGRRLRVVGVDVNAHAVDTINRGEIHITEPDLDIVVRAVVTEGYLRATRDARAGRRLPHRGAHPLPRRTEAATSRTSATSPPPAAPSRRC